MKRFALLGHNIDYSLSPKIHGILFACFGVKASYELLSASPEELPSAIDRLREFDGFNVTKPHKLAVVPYLAKNYSALASVNTVCVQNKALYGYNTDAPGFAMHFQRTFEDVRGRETLLLGAGGVARVVASELVKMGARVTIANRSYEKAEQLAGKVGAASVPLLPQKDDAAAKPDLKKQAFAQAAEFWADYRPEVVVNGTSLGLAGEQAAPPYLNLKNVKFAYDTVYAPPKTPFLQAAETAGAKIENGLGMLLWQAILAEEIFLNVTLSFSEKINAYQAVRSQLYD